MTRTVPVSATQAPGNLVTGALWNAGPAASNTFLTTVPMCVAYQSATQSLTGGASTALTFDATLIDTDSQHSNVTNNTRLTCQVAGWYWAKANVAFAANGTGNRGLQIAKNGSMVPYNWTAVLAATTFNAPGIEVATLVQLAVGDYIEAYAQQNSGGSLSTFSGGTLNSSLQFVWVHS